MGRRVAGACAAVCALVLVGWGAVSLDAAGPSTRPDGPGAVRATRPSWPGLSDSVAAPDPPAWLGGPAGSDLQPTGIEIINATGVDAMVVDGTGAVWVDGAWQLSRVDPATGSAQTWDASDDAAFATVWAIRPARGGGVWLIEDDRVRLFDGRRFVRDLRVAAAQRGGEEGKVHDLSEVGQEVWVSTDGGVARCTQSGAWSMVGQGSIASAGMLAVDAEAHVWALGRIPSGGPSRHVLLRLVGDQWRLPEGEGAPGLAEEIDVDPAGGLLARYGLAVRRFDGTAWQQIPLLPSVPSLGSGQKHSTSVGADGTVWAIGDDGLYRYEAPGTWRRVVQHTQPALIGLGTLGRDVLVADVSGILRLSGDRLGRVWSSRDRGLGVPVDGVLAVSSDEVWATSEHGVQQYQDGRWRSRWSGLGWGGGSWFTWGSDAQLAHATDATVWAIIDQGLARFRGAGMEVIPRDRAAGWILAGPDGAVWAVEAIWPGWSGWYAAGDPDSSLSLIAADGVGTAVRLPGPAWSVTSLVAGVDGTLWATICEKSRADYCTVPTLMRWNGTWSLVPYPGAGVSGISVAPDGGFWALLTSGDSVAEEPVVARYADGTWTRFPESGNLEWITPQPQGLVCGVDVKAPELVCLGPSGRVSSVPLAVPARVRIAPDGSLWMQDGTVLARLPGALAG